MKLKSYFSGTVEAAMELARKELGEDALLINARPATRETRGLGAFEVVFGIPPGVEPAAAPPPPQATVPLLNVRDLIAARAAQPAIAPSMENTDTADLRGEVAGLRREIERMARVLEDFRFLDATGAVPAEDLFKIDATLGRSGSTRAMVALVGPPGAGKTTTLIKLAMRYGIAARKPVRLLSTDVYRIAAADQLRTLAAVLGCPFAIARTPNALEQALVAHGADELLFIDTPGTGPRDMEGRSEWARVMSAHLELDVHLVLSGTMNPRELRPAIERFAAFRPEKLLITHVEEAGSCATLIRESARCDLPVSFLGFGQGIPEDLEPATPARLAGLAQGKSEEIKSTGAAA